MRGRASWPTLKAHGVDPATLAHVQGSFNLLAFFGIVIVTVILVIGIQESANFNSAIVIIKVAIVLTFIAIATGFVILKNPDSCCP